MAQKIGYIVSRFPKISETFILDEILELQKRGVDIEVFSLLKEQESKVHSEAEKLKTRIHYPRLCGAAVWLAQFHWLSHHPSLYVRSWRKALFGNLDSFSFFLRALFVVPVAAYFALEMKRRNIQHVHAHWATHPALAAFLIRELTGIPYSITAHAHDLYVNRSMLQEKLAGADFIVTISDYNRTFLRAYGAEVHKKVQVVHCGISPDVFRPRTRSEPTREMSILCVASLNDYKGHRYLMEGCSILKTLGVPFHCYLAGDGPERARIEAQVEQLGLEKQVSLLSWQTRDEILRLMKKVDVVALPSIVTSNGKQEGIPVALMEAMAMEIPVVATRISGLPELIEDGKTGFLVEQKDPSALARALHYFWQNPEAATQMGRFGRTKVLNEFSLQANAEKLNSLFTGRELAGGSEYGLTLDEGNAC